MTVGEASQAGLLVVAIIAAGVAYRQIETFTRLELIKILDEPRVKDARRLIYTRKDKKEWWREVDADKAAAIVCSSFDLVGHVASGHNLRFFARYWWYSICFTHDALKGYLEERRISAPKIYKGYERLFESALKHDDRLQSARGTSN